MKAYLGDLAGVSEIEGELSPSGFGFKVGNGCISTTHYRWFKTREDAAEASLELIILRRRQLQDELAELDVAMRSL